MKPKLDPGLLLIADPAKGAIVRQGTAQEALRLWNQLEVIQITGAGHSIHREGYLETMKAANDFLNKVGV